jgi:hypothetical protein
MAKYTQPGRIKTRNMPKLIESKITPKSLPYKKRRSFFSARLPIEFTFFHIASGLNKFFIYSIFEGAVYCKYKGIFENLLSGAGQ